MSVPPALMPTDSLAFGGTAVAPAARRRMSGAEVVHAVVKQVVIDESNG